MYTVFANIWQIIHFVEREVSLQGVKLPKRLRPGRLCGTGRLVLQETGDGSPGSPSRPRAWDWVNLYQRWIPKIFMTLGAITCQLRPEAGARAVLGSALEVTVGSTTSCGVVTTGVCRPR